MRLRPCVWLAVEEVEVLEVVHWGPQGPHCSCVGAPELRERSSSVTVLMRNRTYQTPHCESATWWSTSQLTSAWLRFFPRFFSFSSNLLTTGGGWWTDRQTDTSVTSPHPSRLDVTVTYFDQHHIPPHHAPCRTHAAALWGEDVYRVVSSTSSREVVSSPHQHTAAKHLQKTSRDSWTQNRKFQQSVTHTFGDSQSWNEFHRRREF